MSDKDTDQTTVTSDQGTTTGSMPNLSLQVLGTGSTEGGATTGSPPKSPQVIITETQEDPDTLGAAGGPDGTPGDPGTLLGAEGGAARGQVEDPSTFDQRSDGAST